MNALPDQTEHMTSLNTASAHGATDRSTVFQRGEIPLAFGMAFLTLTLAVFHFVMGVFLAVIPALITVPLLVAGMLRARDTAGLLGRQLGGAALLLAGMAVLSVVMFKSCGLSYQLAIHEFRPTVSAPAPTEWLALSGMWFLPILCVYPGISLWTNWGLCRRAFWCSVVVAASPAVIVVHQTLAALGFPLTA